MGKIIALTGVLLSALFCSGQKLGISFDKHTLLILEDMYLVKPLDNTCGETRTEDGSIDYMISIDSIDNQHIRLQANDEFYDCNLSFFTNRGIIGLELYFNNDSPELFKVIKPTDLVYQYKKEISVTEAKPEQKLSNTNIEYIFSKIDKPDFKLASTTDLVNFTLTNIISHNEYIYIMMVIDNQSSIDYEISGVIFSQSLKSRGNKSGQDDNDYLELVDMIEPENKTISSGNYEVLCYQLKKFTLTKNNELHIDFNERNGRRKDKVIIKRNFFNRNTRLL